MRTKQALLDSRNRILVLLHDLLMIAVAWVGAYLVRFSIEGSSEPYLNSALAVLPAVIVIQWVFFWYFGLYRGIWRFASLPDLVRIIKAVAMGVLVMALALFFFSRLQHVPRSILPLYGAILVALLGGPRLLYRWFKDHRLYTRSGKPVLIVGGGSAGEMLIRDMLRESESAYAPMGIVDDRRSNLGKEIQGIRVIGTCEEIPELVKEYRVESIIIAMPSANTREMQRVVGFCEQTGIPFQTLPAMDAFISGATVIEKLREVSIDDLLGREPVTLDWDTIRSGLSNHCVLVSGGGGSIGSELCRQIAQLNPSSLIVVDQSEFNLYTIDQELQQSFPKLQRSCCLVDVADETAVEHLVSCHKPDFIFHAAAYKHVPMLESHIREAVRNNVLGTRIMAVAADRHGCKSFVLISTDKAVNPANIMGASKRIAEIYCQNLNQRSETAFITVRFGNVLGSAGSVVPLFRQQIAAGGPVTVTHPKMSRFFMTIPEACQLIMQSGVMGKGGEIYVLDMGESVSITYLAEQMILLSGKEPGKDIEIVYTGLRPGEKLYEELFHEREQLQGTAHEKIFLANHRQLEWNFLEKTIADMEMACGNYDKAVLLECIEKLVPELHRAHEELPDNIVPFAIDQKKKA